MSINDPEDDLEFAYRLGKATGWQMQRGNEQHAKLLLALFNKRGELKSKLMLLGWKNVEHTWYKIVVPRSSRVTSFVNACLMEKLLTDEEAKLLSKLEPI